MPYRFKAAQTVAENVRRIVDEEIADAVQALQAGQDKQRDKNIHEARKGVKKVRGLLRLVRPQLGSDFQNENRSLRDIGRGLSELRDASAIVESFDALAAEEHELWNPAVAKRVRKGLLLKKREKEQEFAPMQVMRSASTGLRGFARRAQQWNLKEKSFSAIAKGLGTSYRAGRKAMRKAARSDDALLYHDWRKRAKDHWYHIRLLEGAWAGVTESREKSLHDLETCLGDDHNLQVLWDELAQTPEIFGGEQIAVAFQSAVRRKQGRLRAHARELGERLYEQKTKRFVNEFERMWEVWSNEKKEEKNSDGVVTG